MSDEISASPEHVEKLLLALPDDSDRHHCLREYLFDQTPVDYREQLVVHFGMIMEEKTRGPIDNLSTALQDLEIGATTNVDLRHLLIDLAKIVGGPKRNQESRTKSSSNPDADLVVQQTQAESIRIAKQFLVSPQKTDGPKAPLEPKPAVHPKDGEKKR